MSGPTRPAGSPPPQQSLRSLAGSSAIFALGNGLSRAVAYALPPVMAGWLAPADMGTIALLSVGALVTRTVIGLGLTTSAGALWFDQDAQSGRDAVIATATLVLLGGSVAGLVLCALASRPVSGWILSRPDGGDLIVLALAGTAIQLVSQPATMALQFQRRPLAHLAVTAATALAGIGLVLLFVAGLGRGARGWLEAATVAAAVGLAMAVSLARIPLWDWRGDIARDLVRLGWPFVPGAAFMAIVQGAGAFVLARVSGIESAGVYNAGFSLGMIMAIATTGFSSAWFPYFQSFDGREAEGRIAFSRVLFICMGVFGTMTVLFYALAPLAPVLFVDPRYHAAASIIGDVALMQALVGLWGVLVPVLYFRKRIWLASAVQGLAALVTLCVTVVLVRGVGLTGAAWGALAGVAAMILAQLWINRRLGGPAAAFVEAAHGWCALVAGCGIMATRWLAADHAPLQTLLAGTVVAGFVLTFAASMARRSGAW